jgi:hypothetical protein
MVYLLPCYIIIATSLRKRVPLNFTPYTRTVLVRQARPVSLTFFLYLFGLLSPFWTQLLIHRSMATPATPTSATPSPSLLPAAGQSFSSREDLNAIIRENGKQRGYIFKQSMYVRYLDCPYASLQLTLLFPLHLTRSWPVTQFTNQAPHLQK